MSKRDLRRIEVRLSRQECFQLADHRSGLLLNHPVPTSSYDAAVDDIGELLKLL